MEATARAHDHVVTEKSLPRDSRKYAVVAVAAAGGGGG